MAKSKQENTKGVVLLAIGDPAYGKMAANMAVSLKYYNPDIKIQLIHEPFAISHLGQFHRSFFDVLTEIKPEHARQAKNKLYPALAKLKLYDYSVFDENIYLDVDGVCIRDISDIWKLCKDGFYFSQMSGVHEIKDDKNDFTGLQWAKVNDIISQYGLKTGAVIPAINSSFQYWKKCDQSKELFDLALSLLNDPIPLNLHPQKWTKQNQQPDELYMDVALAKLNIMPEMDKKEVIYFSNKSLKKDVEKDFYFLGLYGGAHFTHKSIQDRADVILFEIYRKFHRVEHLYKVHVLLKNKI